MSSKSVNVITRIRAQHTREKTQVVATKVDGSTVLINDKSFAFNYAFDRTATQSEIYSTCVKDLVAGVFSGLNATIFAYGQTGSGKTYTMGTGVELKTANSETTGIVPRAVKQIFDTINELRMKAKDAGEFEPKFTIEVQFIEIYNEEIVDLLVNKRTVALQIQENPSNGQIIVKNVKSISANSIDEVFAILKKGTFNRTTGSTNMNEKSSRSHAIFSLHIKQETSEMVEGNENILAVLTAKLHFVDLAGSERMKRTGATGERAKECISINGGLLALGNVISALTESKKTHVPYRDSKLTRLLQDSLGGNSQTLMIACASPNSSDAVETINTLTYATRAKGIKNLVTVNKDHEAANISQLKARILTLETELAELKQGTFIIEQPTELKVEENDNVDLVKSFETTTNEISEAFKTRFNNAIGNRPQIDAMIEMERKLVEASEAFKENLEEFLHVLQIPSHSKGRRDRRDTIFDSRSRKEKKKNPYITLMAIDEEDSEESVSNEPATKMQKLDMFTSQFDDPDLK